MKIKTSELTGRRLAYAVGIAERCRVETWHTKSVAILFPGAPRAVPWNPHESWNQGGPIIERELICVDRLMNGEWIAIPRNDKGDVLDESEQTGSTPLIAAMRCHVASKLGDEVEIPEELV